MKLLRKSKITNPVQKTFDSSDKNVFLKQDPFCNQKHMKARTYFLFGVGLLVAGIITFFTFSKTMNAQVFTKQIPLAEECSKYVNPEGSVDKSFCDEFGPKIESLIKLGNILDEDSTNSSAYFERGDIQYYMRDYIAASNDYTNAIKYDPNCAEAYYNRAVCYSLRGFHKQAINDFSQAYKNLNGFFPSAGVIKTDAGDHERKIVMLTENINNGIASSRDYIKRGDSYLALNMRLNAMGDYKSAIEINNTNAEAHYKLGDVYYQSRRYGMANKEFDNAVDLDSRYKSQPYFIDYETSQSFCNNTKELYETYCQLKLQPENKDLLSQLAKSYCKMGKFYLQSSFYVDDDELCCRDIMYPEQIESVKRALDYFENAILYDRKCYEAYLHSARCSYKLSYLSDGPSIEEVIEKLTRGLAFNSPAFLACDMFGLRALNFERIGDYSSAIADYTQIINLIQNDYGYDFAYEGRAGAYCKLAEQAQASGDIKGMENYYFLAIEDYTRCIELNYSPSNYWYFHLRSEAYRAWGKKDEADDDWDTYKQKEKEWNGGP